MFGVFRDRHVRTHCDALGRPETCERIQQILRPGRRALDPALQLRQRLLAVQFSQMPDADRTAFTASLAGIQ